MGARAAGRQGARGRAVDAASSGNGFVTTEPCGAGNPAGVMHGARDRLLCRDERFEYPGLGSCHSPNRCRRGVGVCPAGARRRGGEGPGVDPDVQWP